MKKGIIVSVSKTDKRVGFINTNEVVCSVQELKIGLIVEYKETKLPFGPAIIEGKRVINEKGERMLVELEEKDQTKTYNLVTKIWATIEEYSSSL